MIHKDTAISHFANYIMRGGTTMQNNIFNLIELFTAFFLANIASKYVTNFIDSHLKVKNEKKEHDFNLAKRILDLFDSKSLNFTLDNLSNGHMSKKENDNICEIIELYKYDNFFNNKIQKQFEKYAKTFKEFQNFSFQEFSTADYDKNQLQIHKYEKIPDGHSKYSENIKKTNEFLDEIEEEFNKLEKTFRNKYPSLF